MKFDKMICYKGKEVLITGGLGFVGSNLARTLVKGGANVTIADSLNPDYGGNLFNIQDIRDNLTLNICDIRDSFATDYLLRGKDYLFNLAAQTSHIDSMIDPRTDLDINAAAQLTMLEGCRKVNPSIKIVFTSTRQVYGRPDYLPVDEVHPLRPVDVNGINKLAGEWYHLLYSEVYGISACVLRLTNTYGPRMRVKDARQTFLGIWIRSLLEGKAVRVFGDGMQVRDFNYIDDCVAALLLAGVGDQGNGKVYNLGGEEAVNLRELAEILINLRRGSTFELTPFPVDRKAIDIGDCYSNFGLFQKEFGWRPSIKLQEGLKQTLDYYVAYHRH